MNEGIGYFKVLRMRFISSIAIVIAISIMLFSINAEASGPTYDAFADFSSQSNPTANGIWRYGYSTALTGPLNLYTVNSNANNLSWWTSGVTDPNVIKNVTNNDITVGYGEILIPKSEYLHVHPGPAGELSKVRWTAPAAGTYLINATFTSLRLRSVPTTTDVHVLVNSSSIHDGYINGLWGGPTSSLQRTVSLNAGDTIDFAVGWGTNLDYRWDSTGLKAAISYDETANIAVAVVPDRTQVDEPGGDVTYTVTVNNLSQYTPVTLNSICDNKFGAIAVTGSLTCPTGTLARGTTTCSLPVTIQPNDNAPGGADTYTCTFVGTVAGAANTTVTNTVTAKGTDPAIRDVQGQANASVSIGDILPTAAVVETVPSLVSAVVRYQVNVTNTDPAEPLTLTSLVDRNFGDIANTGNTNIASTNCIVPQTLQPNNTYTCTFNVVATTSPLTGQVTGTLNDDDGHTINPGSDDLSVQVSPHIVQ